MITEALTAAVKRHLKITWESDQTAAEVYGIMTRAESILNHLLGTEVDYSDASVSGSDLELYLSMCLYLYNGMTVDEYLEAYRSSLLMARQFHVPPINTEDDDENE